MCKISNNIIISLLIRIIISLTIIQVSLVWTKEAAVIAANGAMVFKAYNRIKIINTQIDLLTIRIIKIDNFKVVKIIDKMTFNLTIEIILI